jgi:hypothetical protein
MFNATMSQKPLETAHAMTHAFTETMKKITEANMQAIHASTKAYFDGITTCCTWSQKLGEENLQQTVKTGTTTGK